MKIGRAEKSWAKPREKLTPIPAGKKTSEGWGGRGEGSGTLQAGGSMVRKKRYVQGRSNAEGENRKKLIGTGNPPVLETTIVEK